MVSEFEDVGTTVKAYSATGPSIATRVVRKLLRRAPSAAPQLALQRLGRSRRFDLIYANTVEAGVAMAVLRPLARRCVAHVHEMPTLIASLDPRLIRAVREHADRIVVPSSPVAQGLTDEHGCEPARISVVHGFVSELHRPDLQSEAARQRVRGAAGITPESWVLGVCGSASDVKGTDLLPRLAAALPEAVAGRPVHLVHVGRFGAPRERLMIERDARLLGVEHRLHLLGPTADPATLMTGFDVHLLPSREESLGLVVLEAAVMGIPTVCFASGGGAAHFCADGAGIVVPYLRTDDMASAAVQLLGDAAVRKALGLAARERWRFRHRTETALPRWLEIIESEVATGLRA